MSNSISLQLQLLSETLRLKVCLPRDTMTDRKVGYMDRSLTLVSQLHKLKYTNILQELVISETLFQPQSTSVEVS